jgi:hypothetical protein
LEEIKLPANELNMTEKKIGMKVNQNVDQFSYKDSVYFKQTHNLLSLGKIIKHGYENFVDNEKINKKKLKNQQLGDPFSGKG